MQPLNFDEIVEKITGLDRRYHREAYFFVREGLDFTQKQQTKGRMDLRHVSGHELLAGIRDYGLKQYGPMMYTLLEEWGVRSSADFGEIVFNMVDQGLLSKTEKDSREDFKDGLDFFEAFQKPFRPSARTPRPDPANSPEKPA